jgi:hypothetical protein
MFGSATHWENHSDVEVWFCSFCIFTVKMPLDVKFKIGILFEAQRVKIIRFGLQWQFQTHARRILFLHEDSLYLIVDSLHQIIPMSVIRFEE